MLRSEHIGCRARSGHARAIRRGFAGGLTFLVLGFASPAAAQVPTSPSLRTAVAAYDAGDLTRALELLGSIRDLTSARDSSIRSLYIGLVHYALGEPARAREAFLEAVRTDPTLRLDPSLHAPTRVRTFDEARQALAEEWRDAARTAQAQGREAEAIRNWELVLAVLTADDEAQARLEGIRNAQLSRAAADSLARIRAQESPPQNRTVTPPTEVRRSPGRAFAMGLLLPGLGHMYTGRRARGGLAMATSAGILLASYLSHRVVVDCRTELVSGTCPPGEVLSEHTERPYMGAGIAAVAAITVIAAIDAMLGVRRANETAGFPSDDDHAGFALAPGNVKTGRDGAVRIDLLRVRFR